MGARGARPQLTFEGGKDVFLSVLEVWRDGRPMAAMGHITVFFDETVARQFDVGVELQD